MSGSLERAFVSPRKRPKVVSGTVDRFSTGCGSLYVTITEDDQGLCELFTALGKAGGCAAAQLEAIARLVSVALRSGVDPQVLIKHLRGIRCPSIGLGDGVSVLSCADAVGMAIQARLERNGGAAK